MNRFMLVALGVVCGTLLGTLAGCGSRPATAPKDTRKGVEEPADPADPVVDIGGEPVDLTELHALIAKAVKEEKWPSEADEKKIRSTLQSLMDRAAKAGGREPRQFPLNWDTRKKQPVTAKANTFVDQSFVLAGEVRGEARDSIILTPGDIRAGSLRNCVVVAKSVRVTQYVGHCLIVADEFIGGAVSINGREDGPGYPIFVAGRWIRMGSIQDMVCHVIRPEVGRPPDRDYPAVDTAIWATEGKQVTFLNARRDVGCGGGGPKECRFVPQKTPIAK